MSEPKTATHPIFDQVTITFTEEDHKYTDSCSVTYTSTTELWQRYFSVFNALDKAKEIAINENRLEMDILAEWAINRDYASALGTRCHQYAEDLILGKMYHEAAQDARELAARKAIDVAITKLSKIYEFWKPEAIVFDPISEIAGQIDLPARNKKTGALAILDWKTNKKLDSNNYGRYGLDPLQHLPDNKLTKYALQLSTYARMMLRDYVPDDMPVELAAIHLPPHSVEPVWYPLPFLIDEVDTCFWKHTWEGKH